MKQTQKKVIYLTRDEMKSILAANLTGENLYLELVRDIFMFCCFSSLRWNDVRDDHIEVTTIKTADSISRTFIVNALSRGISPTIVMQWTGHASYSSMKPYIDIVDSIKATEMAKMNFMD